MTECHSLTYAFFTFSSLHSISVVSACSAEHIGTRYIKNNMFSLSNRPLITVLTSEKIDTDYIDVMWPVCVFCELHNKTRALFPWLLYAGICRWRAQLWNIKRHLRLTAAQIWELPAVFLLFPLHVFINFGRKRQPC